MFKITMYLLRLKFKQTAGNKKIEVPGVLLISGSLLASLNCPFSQICEAG
jgi:hypothetical protein